MLPPVGIHLETQRIVLQQLTNLEYAVRGKPQSPEWDAKVKPASPGAPPNKRIIRRETGQFECVVPVDGDVAERHRGLAWVNEPGPVRPPKIWGVRPGPNLHDALRPR